MPSSARKSSLNGARRGLQKAHIPYRGDNPEIGKKTGIAIQHVERMSDGFEPFDVIMQQADKRTPLKSNIRKPKSASGLFEQEVNDENGEMSMELDDTPTQYFASARAPPTPVQMGRSKSYSQVISRTSQIDFDEIPSPHSQTATQISSNGSRPGPSSLRHYDTANDEVADSESEIELADQDQSGVDPGTFDDFGPQETGESDTPRKTSFTEMDRDDDDEDVQHTRDVLPPISSSESRGNKGKRKMPLHETTEDENVENEIAQGLEDVNQYSELDEEGEAAPLSKNKLPQRKKIKIVEEKLHTKSRTISKKENKVHREGVRRSAREHYAPLEWWRGEKMVYGRVDSSGPVLVPSIREIRRIPKEVARPLGTAGKHKRASTRPRSKAVSEAPVQYADPEEGWDDKTPPKCTVLDYDTKEETYRRIAYTAKMVNPRKAANSDWSFDKIFGDAEFVAAGQLVIPPRSRKPSKGTKDNTYIFYVIEGAVNLKVHDTSLILATGGMFMVPRGNTYFIENISDRDARIFFTQARKVISSATRSMSTPVGDALRKGAPRSSSGAAIATGQGTVNG